MKKFFFLLCLLIIYLPSIYSQEFITLAYWDFKDGDSVVDSAISINANKEIQVNFEGTITYPSSSSPKAISSTGWTNGSNTKYWLIDINTTGYKDIRISSKQYSTSKGPRDFKVQYRLNGTSWTDVEYSEIIVATNFTFGVAENISLPDICNNQEQIFLRWIMISDTSVDGSIITNTGVSRIADIRVEGLALEQFQQYSLAISRIGNGFITPDTGIYNYDPQTNITIKAEAIEGYNFSGWSGDLISSNESEQIRIDSNISITANFTEIKYQIFLNEIIGGNAEILVSQKDDISFNDSIIVRINAIEKGKNVKSFTITDSDRNSIDFEILSEENTYTFFMPAKDVFITLELEQTITLLAQWDFIDGDVIVDTSDVQNNSTEITTNAGTLSFPTTSSPKAVSSTGWINGANEKYWTTTINTSGYESISLSSKQYGSSKGPRDFKIQCRLNGTEWINLENSEIIVATDFIAGIVESIPLPNICNNQEQVFLRWIMISDTSVDGSIVTSGGASRIADIQIKGIQSENSIQYALSLTCNNEKGEITPKSGTYYYNPQTEISITAEANEGFRFAGWTGDTVSSNQTISILLDADKNIVANFISDTSLISVNKNPENAGNITGEGKYTYLSQAEVTAIPNNGYKFLNWSDDSGEISPENPYSFTVTENLNITANFILDSFNVLVDINPEDAGIITGAEKYVYQSQAELSAIPNNGYKFLNWSNDLGEISSKNPYSFTVTEDLNITANFILDSFDISVDINPENAGNVTGNGMFVYQSQAELTAIPNNGYKFLNWSNDAGEISSNNPFSLTVTENTNITANFATIKYQIFLNEIIGGDAEILVSQEDDISFNDSIIVRINAIEKGKNVKSFTVTDFDGNFIDLETLSEENSYTFLMPAKDVFITLELEQTITLLAKWDFIDGDVIVDISDVQNNSAEITTNAGTLSFPTSSSPKAISSTGWVNGSDEKYWTTAINTSGYENIILSSKQYSSAKGPRNFKIQCRLNGTEWIDVDNSEIIVATDFTSGVVENIPLPNICNNQEQVFLRWIMTSDTSVDGSIVTSGGASRIADIQIKGTQIENAIQYALSLTCDNDNGMITPESGTYYYNPQTEIFITAEANEGFRFAGWEGDTVSSSQTISILMDAHKNIVANFVSDTSFISVQLNPEDAGIVSGTGKFVYLSQAELTAIPNNGYKFLNWSNDSGEISSENPYSFTVTEDLNITANFIKQNNDASLSDLTFSEGVLVPDFAPDINEYHLYLENEINFITIEAETNNDKATIDGIGNIDINNADIIEIIVTAEDNDTQMTYIINISKNTTDIKEPDTYFTNQFIYPNPAKEHLNIDLTYFISEISLQIFTLSGEIVYDKTLKNGEIHKISLKNFSKGIHFVKMNNQITKIIIF